MARSTELGDAVVVRRHRPVPGSHVGRGGIEIDKRAAASPPGLIVLAEISNLFGPGFTAEMTYYETPRGAKVFAAGAFTLAGSVRQPAVKQLLSNLWERLAESKG